MTPKILQEFLWFTRKETESFFKQIIKEEKNKTTSHDNKRELVNIIGRDFCPLHG